jgi:hypothetical protein
MSTPMTTEQDNLQSRLPDPAQFFDDEVAAIAGAMAKATGNGSIPQTTMSLVGLRAGQIVGRRLGDVKLVGCPAEVLQPRHHRELLKRVQLHASSA